MNERIRELSKQAGDYVNETYTPPVRSKTPGKIWEDGHIDWHTQFNEKFAQLIVQECARVFESEVDTWKQMDPYQGSIKRKGTKAIREHFGVEE